MEIVWRVSGECLEGVLRVSGRYLEVLKCIRWTHIVSVKTIPIWIPP